MILQGQAACSIDKTVEGQVSEPNAGSLQGQYYRGKLPVLLYVSYWSCKRAIQGV